MTFDYAVASDQGPRAENEDSVGVWPLKNGGLAIAVAEGLGGHIGGKRASAMAIEMFGEAIKEALEPDLGDIARKIHYALRREQGLAPQMRNMATTFSAAVVDGTKIKIVHSGDTRVVLQRGSGIKKLTEDHTEAQRLLRSGTITKDEFANYPRKNVLESALGTHFNPTIDVLTEDLFRRDRIFLSSDGVHGKVSLKELKAISDRSPNAEMFVRDVVDTVRARRPDDNLTIAAVFAI